MPGTPTKADDLLNGITDCRLAQLYRYWLTRRGSRRYPSRHDIDPVDLRYVLGHLMLLDVLRDPVRFRVRLHGSMMAQQAGYDLTGKFLDQLPFAEYRDYVVAQCKRLIESGDPRVVHHNRVLYNR